MENMKALGSLLYKYALPRHLSDMNYAQFLEIRGEQGNSWPAFNQEQIDQIRAAVGKVPYAEEICVLIYTGFRPSELFALRKDDYREIDGIPCLIGGCKTAAGKNRSVTVSPKIQSILDARMAAKSEWLFPDAEGRKMTLNQFRTKCFYPALQEMGIQKKPERGDRPFFVPYSCRHTFSNLLKHADGADRDKADLMGHTDYRTTRRIYQTAEMLAKKAITDQL